MKEFAALIFELTGSGKWGSKTKWANLFGCSKSNLTQWFNDETMPNAHTLKGYLRKAKVPREIAEQIIAALARDRAKTTDKGADAYRALKIERDTLALQLADAVREIGQLQERLRSLEAKG